MKVLVAFNQKALIVAFSMIVNTSCTFVCSSIVLALLTHILADSGHSEDRGGVQQQCRARQFSDTGDCSRTSDAHLNQHFGEQSCCWSKFCHFLISIFSNFQLFFSHLIPPNCYKNGEEIRSWSCFQTPQTVTNKGARRKTHHTSGTNLHLLQSPADMTLTQVQ